jgi:DNA polymerase III epsilon subunit-like protein
MTILAVDTETSGLPPKRRNQDVANWPRIVQLSYILYDPEKNVVLKVYDAIIKMKPGFSIPAESTAIHGITNEMSAEQGVDIETALEEFYQDAKDAKLIVAHNMDFDLTAIKIEMKRLLMEATIDTLYKYNIRIDFLDTIKQCNYNSYCTMQSSIYICNLEVTLKNGDKYKKYPKLSELYRHLFNEEPKNMHNALNDVIATLRCYMMLKHKVDIMTTNTSGQMGQLMGRI